MDNNLWEKAASFHGHKCSGLAIGYKVGLLAIKTLDINMDIEDEDIVCLSETDACGVDALQVMFKATTGTGSLRINYTGKQAFNIYNRKNGKKARFVLKEIPEFNKKEERMNYILNTQEEELFNIKEPAFEFPEKAKIYNSYICSKCMEKTAENKIEFINNKPVCSQCIKGE